METLGRLEEITDLRKVWSNEATNFTPWLAADENISLLADAVDLVFEVDETESHVGDFRADILATEAITGRRIIIENQLEDTNHDHLGKLITYAAGKSADIIIWIVKHAREEHRAAVEWLNNHTDDKIGFFLCEIKLYRIGDSAPAVKFEVVERPNGWAKELRTTPEGGDEKQQQHYQYWEKFLDYALQKNLFENNNFKRRKPAKYGFIDFHAGFSGCPIRLSRVLSRGELYAEFNIPNNKDLFRTLYEKKDAIESEAGLQFDWQEMPDKKASRIVISRQVSFDDENARAEQFDWLIDVMLRLKKTFSRYL